MEDIKLSDINLSERGKEIAKTVLPEESIKIYQKRYPNNSEDEVIKAMFTSFLDTAISMLGEDRVAKYIQDEEYVKLRDEVLALAISPKDERIH